MSVNGSANGGSLDERDLILLEQRVEGRLRSDMAVEVMKLGVEPALAALERRIAKQATGALGDTEILAIVRAIAEHSRRFVQPQIDALKAELAARDVRIDALEAGLAWVKENMLLDGGTWKPDKTFAPHEMATYRGKQWVCCIGNTGVRPGTSNHWRLTEKYQR